MDMRRVVTSDRSGRSGVLFDGRPAKVFGGGGYEFGEVWSTEAPAPNFASDVDRTVEFAEFSTEIKPGETRFRLCEFPPGMDAPMHTTPTIDYITVLSGSIDLELEDGSEVRLGPGDTCVQRGTRHAWHNRGSEPFRMAVVMIGSDAPAGSADEGH
jgi:quercetin dioxygenase-like cupin family protein